MYVRMEAQTFHLRCLFPFTPSRKIFVKNKIITFRKSSHMDKKKGVVWLYFRKKEFFLTKR